MNREQVIKLRQSKSKLRARGVAGTLTF